MNTDNRAEENRSFFKRNMQFVLISFCISILIFAIIVWCMPIQFETNDDPGIRAHWAGWRTGCPQISELGFSTIGMGFIISGLYGFLPMIPWFTIMHLGIMGFSFCSILYTLLSISYKAKKTWLAYIAIIPLLALCVFSLLMLQFTVTPAFAIGAAIVIILHYKNDNVRGNFIITLVTLIILLVSSYSLRPNSFFIGLPLFLCVIGVRFYVYKRLRKQLTVLLLVPLTLVGILYGVNERFYSSREEYAVFREYNFVRSRFMDFPKPHFHEVPEVYTRVGLDEMETHLLLNWYFTFEKVDMELFAQLNESVAQFRQENPEWGASMRDMGSYFVMIKQEPSHLISFGLMILCLLAVLLSWQGKMIKETDKKKIINIIHKHSDKLIAGGIFLFFLLANIYFVEIGRFPSRVYRALVLISAPPLLYMSGDVLSRHRFFEIRKVARKGCYILSSSILAGAVLLSLLLFATINPRELEERRLAGARHGGLVHEYAVNNPQYVFFTELVTMRTSPFLVFPDAKPTNLIPAIGAGIHSPTYNRQIALNGFTHMSEHMLFDTRARLLTRALQPALIIFYYERFPDYEFIQVGNIGEEVHIYRLLPVDIIDH